MTIDAPTVPPTRAEPGTGTGATARLQRFLRGRIVHAVIVIFVVSVAVTLLVELVPGDPAAVILGENATPETLELARERLGLDESLVNRYLDWAGNALQGDLGQSIRTNEHVTAAIADRLPVTLQLTVMALLIALGICFPLAMYMATHAGNRFDRWAEHALSAFIAAPAFVVGVILLYVFGVQYDIFPVVGWVPISENLWENVRHAFLPALTVSLIEIASFTRILRGDLITTLEEDHILAARAKGISPRRVLLRHALRPSLFTLVTLAGLSFARLLGGTVIVESLFSLPGLGRLVIDAVGFGDLPVVQGTVIVVAVAYIILNLLVDHAYGWLDPRVRAREAT